MSKLTERYGGTAKKQPPKKDNNNSKKSSGSKMSEPSFDFTKVLNEKLKNNNASGKFGGFADLVKGLGTKQPKEEKAQEEKPKKAKGGIEGNVETMEAFVKAVNQNKNNRDGLMDIIATDFLGVAKIIANHMYDKEYEKDGIGATFNRVMATLAKDKVTDVLEEMLRDGDYFAGKFTEYRRSIGMTLSSVLFTMDDNMSESAIKDLVTCIHEYVWAEEIKEYQDKYGISEEAAIDLVILIPVFGIPVNNFIEIIQYAPNFLRVLLDYDEMIQVMDHENIKNLFEQMFTEEKGTRRRVLAYLLTEPEMMFDPSRDDSDEKAAIYGEYKRALYEVMDDLDFDDIKKVINNLATTLKKNAASEANYHTVFYPDDVVVKDQDKNDLFPNVLKAFEKFLSEPQNQQYKEYFD